MIIKADKSLRAYYNEIDLYAAQWLRNLMDEGLITKGDVDERSIEDVSPNDIAGYDRLHFFAGIGVWDYALNQAGWGRGEIWTGSCPCQPFSAAGKGAGFSDERHLWPDWFHLISQCRPEHIFGEQVASKDGLGWLDVVQTDLEAAGYANAAVDLCAAGIGAPHIRQRLWFTAERLGDSNSEGLERFRGSVEVDGKKGREITERYNSKTGMDVRLANTKLHGSHRAESYTTQQNSDGQNSGLYQRSNVVAEGQSESGPTNGLWTDADWLFCRDGKWRCVEPGTSPLVNGAASRVGRLRAYGNAINAEAAKIFIEASMRGAE